MDFSRNRLTFLLLSYVTPDSPNRHNNTLHSCGGLKFSEFYNILYIYGAERVVITFIYFLKVLIYFMFLKCKLRPINLN